MQRQLTSAVYGSAIEFTFELALDFQNAEVSPGRGLQERMMYGSTSTPETLVMLYEQSSNCLAPSPQCKSDKRM